MTSLTVSIVTHFPDQEILRRLLASLLEDPGGADIKVTIIDNSVDEAVWKAIQELPEALAASDKGRVEVCRAGVNLGYGVAHNRVIGNIKSDYHLVLNPDVTLAPGALIEAIQYMERHPEVGMLTPLGKDRLGRKLSLAKRYPSVLDLFLRGFMPSSVRKLFQRRLARYEMRELDEKEVSRDVPIASGCFMFCRTATLQSLNGFSDRFFLYFEDFDLCMRMRKIAGIHYVPAVRIVHYGGNAARKGIRHIVMFVSSAFTFFQLHGWRVW